MLSKAVLNPQVSRQDPTRRKTSFVTQYVSTGNGKKSRIYINALQLVSYRYTFIYSQPFVLSYIEGKINMSSQCYFIRAQ